MSTSHFHLQHRYLNLHLVILVLALIFALSTVFDLVRNCLQGILGPLLFSLGSSSHINFPSLRCLACSCHGVLHNSVCIRSAKMVKAQPSCHILNQLIHRLEVRGELLMRHKVCEVLTRFDLITSWGYSRQGQGSGGAAGARRALVAALHFEIVPLLLVVLLLGKPSWTSSCTGKAVAETKDAVHLLFGTEVFRDPPIESVLESPSAGALFCNGRVTW
mmetsp:Transcript_61393/g.146294  ORF Transcript_61393/g.146294 Transcript_61393/m.146294 type:complete len:218 (+) Transcript_61393:1717-2370(+)